MSFKRPVYWNGSAFQRINQTQYEDLLDYAVWSNTFHSSVALLFDSANGNLNVMEDSRLIAGADSTSTGNQNAVDDGDLEYPQESETAEPETVIDTYNNIRQSIDSAVPAVTPASFNSASFPLFESDGNLQAMTHEDMLDTFIRPAIDLLTTGTLDKNRRGTYAIYSADDPSRPSPSLGYGIVYKDTRADSAAYIAAEIGPDLALDQPKTIDEWSLIKYNRDLFGTDATEPTAAPNLITHDSDGDITVMTKLNQRTMFTGLISWAQVNDPGYKITYQIDSSAGTLPGQIRSSGITDTKLNGSGDYQTRFVDANDYRAQEFPDGTPVTQRTYYLKIKKG